MMNGKWPSRGWLAAGALALALQGCTSYSSVPGVLPNIERQSAGGRDLIVVIPQDRIRGEIQPSNLYLGGLFVGGLMGGAVMGAVDKSIEKSRQRAVDAQLEPLHAALAAYDFDHRAVQATADDLRQLKWWGQRSETMTRDSSDLNVKQMLKHLEGEQTLVVSYDYTLTRDFSALQLTLQTFLVSTRDAASGDPKKIDPAKIAWMDRFIFVENLERPGKTASDNLALWTDDQGQRTRDTLDRGMSRLLALLDQGLTRTADELASIDHQHEVTIGDISGHLAGGSAEGTLLHQPDAQQWIFLANVSPPSASPAS
jgi:hypothetical protein